VNGMPAILLVEDNRKLVGVTKRALELRGYSVRTAINAHSARHAVESEAPDIIVLDIMLSDGNGLDFCREMREGSRVPIIFLTALGEKTDVVKGFNAGADGYLTKPFDFDELDARLRAILRRAGGEGKDAAARQDMLNAAMTLEILTPEAFSVGPFRFDIASSRAYIQDRDLMLSPTEFRVLVFLAKNANRFAPSEEIYRAVWDMEPRGDVRTVKQCVYSLRKKIYGAPARVERKRGAGYRLAFGKREGSLTDELQ